MEHKISNELPQIPDGALPEQPMQQVYGAEMLRTQAIETEQAAPTAQGGYVPQPQALPIAPLQQSTPPTPGDPSTAMPTIADDADLIEKEWVEKAKEIVARTRHDPYEQNKEVERMKADYMKKRYNKDIKITED